jgi:Asp/Glu/hydantoin racemase
VRAVVIGGAALGGIAQRVAPQVGVPVIDSVQAGARWAAGVLCAPTAAAVSIDAGVRWSGVSEALAGALAGPGATGH